jgi:hypothetical protein
MVEEYLKTKNLLYFETLWLRLQRKYAMKFSFVTNVKFIVRGEQNINRQGKRKIKKNCIKIYLILNSLWRSTLSCLGYKYTISNGSILGLPWITIFERCETKRLWPTLGAFANLRIVNISFVVSVSQPVRIWQTDFRLTCFGKILWCGPSTTLSRLFNFL